MRDLDVSAKDSAITGVARPFLGPIHLAAFNIHGDADVTPGGNVELSSDGKPTGVIVAGGNALGKIFDRLPKPTPEQQIDGSKAFFREMNGLGITGIVDGGGVSMYPSSYQTLFKLWHDKELTVRVAYHLCSPKPGSRHGCCTCGVSR